MRHQVTYSALLDRLVRLERLVYPDGNHTCSHPNDSAPGPAECAELYTARREANDVAMQGVLATMAHTDGVGGAVPSKSVYLIRALDPNGAVDSAPLLVSPLALSLLDRCHDGGRLRLRSRRGLLRHRLTVSFGTPPQRGCFHGCPYAQCGDEVTRQPISHTDEVTDGRCERRNGRQVARLLARSAGKKQR